MVGNTNEDHRDREFVFSQMTQAVETYRVQYNLLIQIATALITADVAIVGFAFSTTNAGVLAIGALFPLTLLLVYWGIGRRMIPIVYSAVMMETQLGSSGDHGLISSFLNFTIGTKYTNNLRELGKTPDIDERMRQLRKMKSPVSKSLKGELLILLVFFAQIAFSILATIYFNWTIL